MSYELYVMCYELKGNFYNASSNSNYPYEVEKNIKINIEK